LSAPITAPSVAFMAEWAVRPTAASELLRRSGYEEEHNVLRESFEQAEAMSPDHHSEQLPFLPFGLNYVASVPPGLVASFVTAGHQWAKLWHGFGTAGVPRSNHPGSPMSQVIVG